MHPFFLTLSLLLASIVGFFNPTPTITIPTTPTTTAIIVHKTVPTQQTLKRTQTTPRTATSSSQTGTTTNAAPNVTFSVDGISYHVYATPGETVIDAMHALSSDTSFTFSGTDYPSIGFFVESIDGKVAAHGFNWMLYVNGAQAGSGASEVTLNSGDVVEWKYEQ